MTKSEKRYFMCGIGGSGMLPLALILKAKGLDVEGSDRALDQGRLAPKFESLAARGIALHPQDGSGLKSAEQVLVASAAVEDTVPDVVAARRLGAARMFRAELLAELFNAAPISIGVAGTSGKSTTTAMIAHILSALGGDPTVMNGAPMKNFPESGGGHASARVGAGEAFVSEVDESDGSIALFRPTVAVVTNVSLDHKPMAELRALFSAYAARADKAVLNLDNPETALIAAGLPAGRVVSYGFAAHAEIGAEAVILEPYGARFTALDRRAGQKVEVSLKAPGAHNVSNALGALAAAKAAGADFDSAAKVLSDFAGVARRLDFLGEAGGVTVIDDFAHNPDKIAASLAALRAFSGRLLVMFQPHGYGPLAKMKNELVEAFANGLGADDLLVMPEPVYYGGTTDRSVSSADIVAGIAAKGRRAARYETRAECGAALLAEARAGDRLVVMGARDDTLTEFAAGLLTALRERPARTA